VLTIVLPTASPEDRASDAMVPIRRPAERETPVDEPATDRHEIPPAYARHLTPQTMVRPVAPGTDRATLTMLRGPAVGASFSLERSGTILGRTATANIVLQEPSASRQHARITVDAEGCYFIEDLGSTNGTFVCGRPVSSAPLESGDLVQIGSDYTFRFARVDEAEETLHRHLYESSTRDALTSLLNRRSLLDHLATEVERATRNRTDLGVLMIDIDHFKEINDKFGHAAGDRTLAAIALAGSRGLREGDLFARYGGEEFAVLARASGRREAKALAERLRGAVANVRVEEGETAIQVTVSIGVGWLSECNLADGLELFARADARLYAAKRAGRNRVCAEG
jgi:two-component system cell cycle response regulator